MNALDTFYKMNQVRGDTTMHTPRALVEEMLDKLPVTLWSDPKATFLDPACGRGTFLLAIYERLFTGLASVVPDPNTRKNHILKNQLWGVDIDPIMIRLANAAFKLYIKGVTNFTCADSLEYTFMGMKFDVVVGNPPYQAANEKSAMGSKTIWQKFIPLALSLVKRDGYISFIHPQQWRRPNHEILKSFQEKNLLFLKMFSLQRGQKIFGVGTAFDYYILQNAPYQGITEIVDEADITNRRNITSETFIPNKGEKILQQLFNSPTKIECVWGMEFHGQKGTLTPTKGYLTSYYSMEGDTPRYRYFDPTKVSQIAIIKHYVPKVIVQLTGHNMKVLNDYSAQLACGHFCIGLRVISKKEADQMTAWLKKYWKVLDFAKWGMTREYRVFQMLNKDFYKTEFTPEEIAYIESVVK